nr:immunoglobulin heavy chain junction region [Macaca mulatta]MOW32685.1 immunoglobulin heavy chain junction region [Macaca mulatta]
CARRRGYLLLYFDSW